MDYFYKNNASDVLIDTNGYKSQINLSAEFFNKLFVNKNQSITNDKHVVFSSNNIHSSSNVDDAAGNSNSDNSTKDEDSAADINTEEKENVKEIEKYQQYQESQQDNQPWSDSSDIRIVDSDELPDPLPITDTEVCPKCGNHQAHWWIVQTDSADEPSTQFFRCTKCNHTWRTTRSS